MMIRPAYLLLSAIAIATPAFAQSADPLLEARLDIDRDGTLDLARVTKNPTEPLADLSIWLGVGAQALGPDAKPSFVKTGLTAQTATWLEIGDDGSLKYYSGCGGCSADYSTTLTIVYRDAAFWVDAYSFDWDTQGGMGSCDVDLLAGTGVITQGLDDDERRTPVTGNFKPVKLADWTNESQPKECQE